MPTPNNSSKVKLPSNVVTTVINKVKDTSTIARLCPSTPQKFNDTTYLIFNPTSEAEVVAEGQKKGVYEIDTKPIVGKRVKIVTTTRVSDELKWADEDNQLEIIDNIQADQTAAIARALDYVIYHGINPKTGEVMDGYTPLTTEAVQVTEDAKGDVTKDIDALTDALIDYNFGAVALSRAYASKMRKLRVPSTGQRLYPEIPLTLNAGSVDGIDAVVSNTVSGRLAKTPTGVDAILGDFSMIKWGMVRDMWAEVIEYGDPDGSGNDLKAYNEVAYRTEAMFAFAIIDPKAFAVLKAGAGA